MVSLAFEYAIKRVHVNGDGLQSKGAHHFLVHANDVDIVGEDINTTDRNEKYRICLNIRDGKMKYRSCPVNRMR